MLPERARRYFERIAAPQKDFASLPLTGHDPKQPMIDA